MSCVYQIKCKDPKITATYVGSTSDLKKRITQHKQDCKKSQLKLYVFIRDNGGFDNWQFNVLQSYEDISKIELIKHEESFFTKLNAELNTKHPFKIRKDVRKSYYERNKQKELDNCRMYREANKEKERLRHHKYYEENKAKIYEQIKIYRSQKYTCEICGKSVSRGTKARHERSQFHISKIKSNIQNCTNNEQ